jgi:predicted nucleic acid-binding protein
MDPNKLPRRALIDSTVLTRALQDQAPDADTPVCVEFWDDMLASGRRMLIAAPTIAEIIRLNASRTIPRTPQVAVVAFDAVAAELLGRNLPIAQLKSLADAEGHNLTYYKYDAMIAACGARHRAECVVTLDRGFAKLGPPLGIDIRHPSDFEDSQQSMRFGGTYFPTPTPAKK